ncbi:MAG: DUF933 domain-containing protein [Candidatus Omnitrophica bacterium]|nr:DUF933 domain-containing protein [Candidatus Omnitrophota bacterium]
MKIAVLGIDFSLGKTELPDERINKLRLIFHPPKITFIQLEFLDADHLKEADAILAEKNAKLDLILQDLESIEKHLDNQVALRAKQALEGETLLNEIPFSEEEIKLLANLNLVTLKPIYFVDKDNLPSIPEMIQGVYLFCEMISFFTVNEKELRAWSIKKGTTVYEAAGKIHSDLQKGFIKAEVIGFEDLIKAGSLNQAKAKGLIRLEDKEYIVRDGDLIQIRFNL